MSYLAVSTMRSADTLTLTAQKAEILEQYIPDALVEISSGPKVHRSKNIRSKFPEWNQILDPMEVGDGDEVVLRLIDHNLGRAETVLLEHIFRVGEVRLGTQAWRFPIHNTPAQSLSSTPTFTEPLAQSHYSQEHHPANQSFSFPEYRPAQQRQSPLYQYSPAAADFVNRVQSAGRGPPPFSAFTAPPGMQYMDSYYEQAAADIQAPMYGLPDHTMIMSRHDGGPYRSSETGFPILQGSTHRPFPVSGGYWKDYTEFPTTFQNTPSYRTEFTRQY